MKVLLHACCAPCSISCIKTLQNENIEFSLFWYNPNIEPQEEYENRKNCLLQFAENFTLIDADNTDDPDNTLINTDNKNCENCYRRRLEKTALTAAQKGFDSFSTTLLISPYQNHELIKKTGEQAAAKHGVEFLYKDFRPFFREGQAAARSMKLYMQKYCGCSASAGSYAGGSAGSCVGGSKQESGVKNGK